MIKKPLRPALQKADCCFISSFDLEDCKYSDQKPLRLLQESGAPIIGMCILCMDARYHWYLREDPIKDGTWYSWKAKVD